MSNLLIFLEQLHVRAVFKVNVCNEVVLFTGRVLENNKDECLQLIHKLTYRGAVKQQYNTVLNKLNRTLITIMQHHHVYTFFSTNE